MAFKNLYIPIFYVLFFIVFYNSCAKDNVLVAGNEEFCNDITSGNFDSTKQIVNDFLMTLPYPAIIDSANQQQNLGKLLHWLESKTCVGDAQLICYSCIETSPPQSEILVKFLVEKKLIIKVMDIWMGDTLELRSYHE